MLGVGGHSRVSQTHATQTTSEVLLVVELVSSLHGLVSDVVVADGADHGGHDEDCSGTLRTLMLGHCC